MNVVVIGCGRFGAELASRLYQKGHQTRLLCRGINNSPIRKVEITTSMDSLGVASEDKPTRQQQVTTTVQHPHPLTCVTSAATPHRPPTHRIGSGTTRLRDLLL